MADRIRIGSHTSPLAPCRGFLARAVVVFSLLVATATASSPTRVLPAPPPFAAPATALDCSGGYVITGTAPLQLSPGAPSTESPIAGQIQLQESNGQFADDISFNTPFGATGSLWGVIDGSGAVTATFNIVNAQGSLIVATQGTARPDCSLIQLNGVSAGQPVSLILVPSALAPTATPTVTTGPPTYDCTGLYGVTGAPLRLAGTSQLSDTGGSVTGAMTLTAPVATSGLVTATVDPAGAISGTISLQYSGFTFIPLTGQATPGCLTATLTATLNLLGNVITETVTLTQLSGPTPTPTGFAVTATPTALAATPTPTSTSTPGATLPDCTGVYGISGTVPILGQVGGQAVLQQTAGLITGPLTITGLITVTGAVTATVNASGAISGTLALPIPGFRSVPATGQATPDCSSAHLTATIGASTAAFTLTRVSGGPTATPTTTNTPTETPTPTNSPTRTPTRIAAPTNTPTSSLTRTPTAVPTNTPTRAPTATAVPTNTATPQPSAVVALNVKSAWPFHQVVLTGLYFGAAEPVAVYWDSLHTSPLTVTRTFANGTFQVNLSVPQAISGTHVIVALGLQSARYAATTLRVVPALALVPASGAPGGRFVIAAIGFGANEPVTAYWDRPPQGLGTTLSNAQGSAIGASAITATVPLSATVGPHLVYAIGWKSHGVASAAFTVP